MNTNEKMKKNMQPVEKDGISRRSAIRKMGYAAFASSTMFLLLNNPTKVHANSPGGPQDPGENPFPGAEKNNNKSDDGSYGTYDWD